MVEKEKTILGVLYGTELFGRERENIECYKTIQSLGWNVKVFGSYREEGGGAVGRELTRHGLLEGVLPFGSHFAISYFRTIKGYARRQFQRIRDCSKIVRSAIQKHNPSAIVIGSHSEYLYIWPVLLRNRVKVIYRVEDGPIWTSGFHLFAMKRLLKRADAIAVCSHFIAEECARLLPSSKPKTRVIWNIAPSFESTESTNQSEEKSSKQLRIVYVGQMSEKKGVRNLIDALSKIRGRIPFSCRIVGGSQFSLAFEQEMHRLVETYGLSELITFVGRVNDPTPHYHWANLHIAPSIYEEPFGLVIVEAKRAGKPSIVFPKGGMPELIEHGRNGYICDKADTRSLIAAIEACSNAPLDVWGMNAKRHHEKVFSQDRFRQDWENTLQLIDC